MSGVLTLFAAFLSSMIDLIAKNHEKFHFGKDSPFIKNVGKIGNFLTALSYIVTVKDATTDTSTTPLQKIATILTWLGATVGSIVIGAAIASAFMPIVAVPLIAIVYIGFALLAMEMIEWFNENVNEYEFPIII